MPSHRPVGDRPLRGGWDHGTAILSILVERRLAEAVLRLLTERPQAVLALVEGLVIALTLPLYLAAELQHAALTTDRLVAGVGQHSDVALLAEAATRRALAHVDDEVIHLMYGVEDSDRLNDRAGVWMPTRPPPPLTWR